MTSDHFNGQIILEKKSKENQTSRKRRLNFTLPETCPKLEDTFMDKFKDLGFDDFEKSIISQSNRKEICIYRTYNKKIYAPIVNDITKAINQINDDKIHVLAEELGTFICLSTIFSGRLPKNKIIHFELINTPISLFPEEIITNAYNKKNISVEFFYENDHWIEPIKTLHKCSKNIKFKHKTNYNRKECA